MESNNIFLYLNRALADKKVNAIVDPSTGTLCFIKDSMNGAPV